MKPTVIVILLPSLLFGIYHLPYAFLNACWPSHGNWAEAISPVLGQGIPMGPIYGTVYARRSLSVWRSIVHSSTSCSLCAESLRSQE